ncbi:MAG: hypothetical protein J6Y29_01220 [Clostridiales bacterium]|nr:hypothetical protein [Clostridiales bacterium]
MFRTLKYQTGELNAVVNDMRNGIIPMLEVDNSAELAWVIDELKKYSVFRMENILPDKKARDAVAQPDFEFRLAFSIDNDTSNIKYLDIFEEPIPDRDYDPIFGD